MKMIDVSKVRVFRGSLFVLLMLFMRIGWASNDDSTYNIVDFGAKGDGITDNTQFINRTIEACLLYSHTNHKDDCYYTYRIYR